MDLDRLEYARARYTVLDLLASFGGFIGIWGRIFGYFMAMWNFNALQNYMVSRLYKIRRPGAFEDKNSPEYDRPRLADKEFKRSRLPNCEDYIMSWVPNCLVCCKKRGRKKALVMAR